MVHNAGAALPGYVPFTLLLALEAGAIIGFAFISSRRRATVPNELQLCPHCSRLHARTDAFARLADAAAVAALAFLVALPFVAAGFESGFTLARALLAVSAEAAVLAAAAEFNFLVRSAAARLWPRLAWNVEPTRIIGGGARWLGIILAFYMFRAGYAGAGAADPGLSSLFGDIGRRLTLDLASTSTIWAATAILVIAQIVALLSRWLLPLVFNSLPTTLAVRREPHEAL
ncbi:MAG: hypothetical protein ACREML_06720 [Vulcanimicrobiaceae bacterium]